MKITLTRYERNHVQVFTYLYARTLNTRLKRAKVLLLSDMEPDYAFRIFLLHFRTQLGDNDAYWYPLFHEMKKLLRARMDIVDRNALWDAIQPVGAQTLNKIRARIKDHGGPFTFPIPSLIAENRSPVTLEA